jgi:hypothetical protein
LVHGNAFCLRCCLFCSHRGLLSVRPGRLTI